MSFMAKDAVLICSASPCLALLYTLSPLESVAKLQGEMLQGVAVQFPAIRGSGELQWETLEEVVVLVPATGGRDQL